MEENLPELPKPNARDVIYNAVKVLSNLVGQGISASQGIPLDIPLSDLMSAFLEPPIVKRRNKWLEDFAKCLIEVVRQNKELNIEDLQNNESFISAVL